MNTTKLTITQDTIRKIACVQTTYCGHISFDIEEVDSFCNQWLYEQTEIELDSGEIDCMIEDMELSRDDAILQGCVDAAYLAWLESLDYEPTEADSVAITPILQN